MNGSCGTRSHLSFVCFSHSPLCAFCRCVQHPGCLRLLWSLLLVILPELFLAGSARCNIRLAPASILTLLCSHLFVFFVGRSPQGRGHPPAPLSDQVPDEEQLSSMLPAHESAAAQQPAQPRTQGARAPPPRTRLLLRLHARDWRAVVCALPRAPCSCCRPSLSCATPLVPPPSFPLRRCRCRFSHGLPPALHCVRRDFHHRLIDHDRDAHHRFLSGERHREGGRGKVGKEEAGKRMSDEAIATPNDFASSSPTASAPGSAPATRFAGSST